MTIEYPKHGDDIYRIIDCALTHPTWLDGLAWLMTWDTARAIEQYVRNKDGTYETTNKFLISHYTRRYLERRSATITLSDTAL